MKPAKDWLEEQLIQRYGVGGEEGRRLLTESVQATWRKTWEKARDEWHLHPTRGLYLSWRYLEHHPIFWYPDQHNSAFEKCLMTQVVLVDPKTHSITETTKDSITEVWLECGPYLWLENYSYDWEREEFPHGQPSIDYQLSCGGPTFEVAIGRLATRVAIVYGNDRSSV